MKRQAAAFVPVRDSDLASAWRRRIPLAIDPADVWARIKSSSGAVPGISVIGQPLPSSGDHRQRDHRLRMLKSRGGRAADGRRWCLFMTVTPFVAAPLATRARQPRLRVSVNDIVVGGQARRAIVYEFSSCYQYGVLFLRSMLTCGPGIGPGSTRPGLTADPTRCQLKVALLDGVCYPGQYAHRRLNPIMSTICRVCGAAGC